MAGAQFAEGLGKRLGCRQLGLLRASNKPAAGPFSLDVSRAGSDHLAPRSSSEIKHFLHLAAACELGIWGSQCRQYAPVGGGSQKAGPDGGILPDSDAEKLESGALVGIGVGGAGDADLMVGELGVAAGEFDLGHVAADAVRLGHGAGFDGGSVGGGGLRC